MKKENRFWAGLVFGLILAVGLLFGFNAVLAVWSEPTLPPPGGNVNPFVKPLPEVLNDGADAGGFIGNVNIGSAINAANLYVIGGEIKGKWLHATGLGDNTIAGNLAVGKSSAPTAALDVNGETKTGRLSATDGAATNVFLGNLAVGKSAVSTGAILDVNGEIWGTAFVYSSDRRLKENIVNIESPLARIMALRGVVFNWIGNNQKDIGLIAQEVEGVFPEAVQTDQISGLKAVKYGNLIAPLIEAIKAQQKQIEALELKLEKLEK